MSIDILKLIDKEIADYEHIESSALVLQSLREAVVKAMDADYLGDLYRTDYCVTGRGAFPVDMLRYACSWPKDESDVYIIERSHESDVEAQDLFTLYLTKYHRDEKPSLSEDRWAAKFRWKVLPSTVSTVRL